MLILGRYRMQRDRNCCSKVLCSRQLYARKMHIMLDTDRSPNSCSPRRQRGRRACAGGPVPSLPTLQLRPGALPAPGSLIQKALGFPPPRKTWHFPESICREVPDFFKVTPFASSFCSYWNRKADPALEAQSQVCVQPSSAHRLTGSSSRPPGSATTQTFLRHPRETQTRAPWGHELNASYLLPYTQEIFSWGRNSSNQSTCQLFYHKYYAIPYAAAIAEVSIEQSYKQLSCSNL